MSDDKTLKIKKIDGKEVKGKDGEKYKIWVEAKDVKFPKDAKKGETKSTEKIKISYRKTSEKDDAKKHIEMEPTFNSGMFFKGAKLPKDLKDSTDSTKTLELENEFKLSTGGWPQLGFWIALVIGLLIIGGGLYWWFTSSRKEDKEEEGL